MRKRLVRSVWLGSCVFGCASPWKIHGGPGECVAMCRGWNMELTGMVGVGNQDSTGEGATACVCEIPTAGGEVATGAVGTATSTAAVVVALQQAQQQQQQQQQGQN